MRPSGSEDIVFFLKTSRRLPQSYFDLEPNFREQGITLVPVTIDNLLMMSKEVNKVHIVTCITSMNQKQYFERKVRRVITMLVRNNVATFFQISSFEDTNIGSSLKVSRNYYFTKLPVKAKYYCDKISKYYYLSKVKKFRWPGTTSPRMGLE